MIRSGSYLRVVAALVVAALQERSAHADAPVAPDLEAQASPAEIFDERPDKPFDRETLVRLTGAELAERGAVDLATALALLPEVTVRDAGRTGFNVEIRGARQGAVRILVDGVPMADPYDGAFDVSTIPITDIVEIRIATTPQSPIDGPGGAGGVIEVHTRDAIGPQLVIGRLTAGSAPNLGVTGTARAALARHLALRLSGSVLAGSRELALPGDASVSEARHAVTGAGRLEYRDGDLRVAVDGFVDDRHYVSPPSDTMSSPILLIDRETTARASIKADAKLGALQLQVQGWTQYLNRRSRTFADPALTDQQQVEDLKSLHSGATALATRPWLGRFRWAASTTVDFEKAVAANIVNSVIRGETTVLEAAGGLQYQHAQITADLSAGVAIPFEVHAGAWPEGKAVVRYRPTGDFELAATAAYKGRLPSLRERFGVSGNPGLGAERVAHAELRMIQHGELFHGELAPFYRRSTDTIQESPDLASFGQLINLGTVRFAGFDSRVRVTPHPAIEGGASYQYVQARALQVAAIPAHNDPLDRLPHNQWDAWVEGRPAVWLSALARVTYVGESLEQGTTVAGYAMVSASFSAHVATQYLGVLRVDDLFDQRPESRAGYPTPGRVVSLVLQATWH